jgi:hypothetical protein
LQQRRQHVRDVMFGTIHDKFTVAVRPETHMKCY